MGKSWCLYLLTLGGAAVFYLYYFGWFSWFLLVLAICLPGFSFLVSLPAMLQVRLYLDAPERCFRDEAAYVTMRAANGFLPMPRCRFRLKICSVMTGETVLLPQQTTGTDSWYLPLNTAHCGLLRCTTEKGRVYDYLGLFSLPVRESAPVELLVCPRAVQPENLPNLTHFLARRRRPKPGGGFSEEHELRDYRPGDNLRDIHWKLSVKTDRLIVREAQEPVRELTLLTLDMREPAAYVDRTLEELLWLSRWLLDHDTDHHVLWIDPADCQMASVPVASEEDLETLIHRLLKSTLRQDTPSIAARRFERASWRYHICPGEEAQS